MDGRTGELETLADTMDAVIGLDIFDQVLSAANSSNSFQTLRLTRLLRSWSTNGPSEIEVARVLQGVDCLELFSRIIALGENLEGTGWNPVLRSFKIQNRRDGVVPQLCELRRCIRDRTNRIVDASRVGYFGVTATPDAEGNGNSGVSSSRGPRSSVGSNSGGLSADDCAIS